MTSLSRRNGRCHPALVASVAVVLFGCGFGTDAATRMANDLVAGATRLHQDGQRIVVEHAPQVSPEGCQGAFTLTLQPGDGFPNPPGSGGLIVGCEDDPGLAANGYSHRTTYHLNAVRVKELFTVKKQAGETVHFTLMRWGDRVDVVGLE